MVNSFMRNSFRKIYARLTGIYSVEVANFKDIRMHMDGNYYYEIFADEAAIIHLRHPRTLDNNDDVLSFLQDHPHDVGIVMMKNEVVSQCQAMRIDSGLYTAAAEAQLVAFVIRDSLFAQNFLTLFYFDRTSLYCGNCTFTHDALESGFDIT